MLGRTRATYICIRAEPRGPEEPSISDSEVVSDGDDEHYETVGLCLDVRYIVQQKLKHEQPTAQGWHLQGAISVTEFLMYCHILRQSWLTWVRNFGKSKRNLWQHGSCDFGTQEWMVSLISGTR